MAESMKLLKRRGSSFNLEPSATAPPGIKIVFPTVSGSGDADRKPDPLETIRKKFSRSRVEIATQKGFDSPVFPRSFSRGAREPTPSIRIEPSLSRVMGTSRTMSRLMDRHMRGSCSLSDANRRPSSFTDGYHSNKDLFQKYLGPPKDNDFLKIPQTFFNPLNSADKDRNTAGIKTRVVTGNNKKETLCLTIEDIRVFSGYLDDLPPQSRNTVRVFMSSTFTDFTEERNAILKTAYPILKASSGWLGLEFQLVDMRWGVTDEATNAHLTEQLCLKEIESCRRTSFGPYFVCMIGNRYGYRPIPYEINAVEFETLVRLADDLHLENKELFRKWYLRDTNAVPPVCIMQPIKSHFPHFGDTRPEFADNRSQDMTQWNKELQTLQTLFHRSAKAAYFQGFISEVSLRKILISVTEMEIYEAIIREKSKTDSVLCFTRQLNGLETDLNNPIAGRYIDLEKNEKGETVLNADAGELLENLRDRQIPSLLCSENIMPFEVRWKENGLKGTQYPDHDKYIQQFVRSFVHKMQTLIQSHYDAARTPNKSTSLRNIQGLREEILHHASFCDMKCEIFHGRDIEMANVKMFFQKHNRKPLVINAPSGAGKTAMMAAIAKAAPDWLGNRCVRICRFLGTSPDTSSLYSTLDSVCKQICLAYDEPIEERSTMDTPSVVKYLHDLMNTVSTFHADRPLLILLDSVDQLSSTDGAHRLHWLPTILPPGVHLVLSFIPGMFGLSNNAKEILSDDDCYLSLLPLSTRFGLAIVEMYMQRKCRTLTIEQIHLLRTFFAETPPLPLFLKMLVDEACLWRSYTRVSEISIAATVEDAIGSIFMKLERKYGQQLVQFTLGYITVSFNGLSETEIKDVLSCNNDVVNEVYQYHDPPIPGIIRLTHLFWARIRHDISDYIVERQTDGKTTFFWYHRQFIDVARKRYVSEDNSKRLHSDLAEIFLAVNGVRKSITLISRNLKIAHADRQVTPQPLTKHNHRKLRVLPYHLFYSGQVSLLKEQAMCNLFYLVCRIKAFTLNELLYDFSRVLSLVKDTTLELVCECIRQAYVYIQVDIHQLGVHLLGRIQKLEQSDPILAKLCNQIHLWFRKSKAPVLSPVCSCFPMSVGSTVDWQIGGPTMIIGHSDQCRYVLGYCPSDYSHSSQLQVIDLQEKRLAFTIQHFDGYLKAAEIIEMKKYKVKILILTDRNLRVNLYSVGGYLLDSRYLETSFADRGQNTTISHLGFYEHFRFQKYLLRIVLAAEWNIFDVPERQQYHEAEEEENPELILTTTFLEMNVKFKTIAMKVLGNNSIITCHGKAAESTKTQPDRNTLIVWEDGRRSFQALTPSPVVGEKTMLACPQKGDLLIAGCQAGELVVLSKSTNWRLDVLKPDQNFGRIVALTYNSHCGCAASVSDKLAVALFNIHKGAHLFTGWLENARPVRCACVTDDGQHMLTGHKDGDLLVWKINRQKATIHLLNNVRPHTEAVTQIYVQGGTDILTVSEDRTLKVFKHGTLFESEGRSVRNCSEDHTSHDLKLIDQISINDMIIAEKGNVLITSSEEYPPRIWKCHNGSYVRTLAGNNPEFGTLKIRFGCGSMCIVGSNPKRYLVVWNYKTGEFVKSAQKVAHVVDFCVTSDSRTAVALQREEKKLRVVLFNIESQSVTKYFQIGQASSMNVDRVFLTSDDRYFVLTIRTKGMESMASRSLKAVDLGESSMDLIACQKPGKKTVPSSSKLKIELPTFCSESLDGNRMLVGKNGEAFVWEIQHRISSPRSPRIARNVQSFHHAYVIHCKAKSLGSQTHPVVAVAKSNDGNLLATADAEGCVILWRRQKLTKEYNEDGFAVLNGHKGAVTSMMFSESGYLLATGSDDHTIRVWDTKDGCLKHMVSVGMGVTRVLVSSNDKFLVALTKGKSSNRVMIFRMCFMDW